MTDITVVCPSCSALLKLANSSLAGKKVRCPKCKGVVGVPAVADGQTVAAPPPPKQPETLAVQENGIEKTPVPRPKPSSGPEPVRRRSKAPMVVLLLLLVLFFLGSTGAVGAYFAWDWYQQRQQQHAFHPTPVTPNKVDNTTKPTPDAVAKGFSTPDAALDAYVKALRAGDVAAYQQTVTGSRLALDQAAVDWETKEKTPAAQEQGWKQHFQFLLQNEWPDGKYKRFPAEFDGADRAIILCVVQGTTQELRLVGEADVFRKFLFTKTDGGWLQAATRFGNVKDLDAKKYAYAWENTKPPDTPIEPPPTDPKLDEATKKAIAGIKFKPLDVKVASVELTLQAPDGASVEDVDGELVVKHGDGFVMRIEFGKVEMKEAYQRWNLEYGLEDKPEALFSQPDFQVYKFKVGDKNAKESYRFVSQKVVGDFDMHITDGLRDKIVPLADCLLMMYCARTVAVKPNYKPLKSVADLKRIGWFLQENNGKIVSVEFGETPCTNTTLALLPKLTPDVATLYLSGQPITSDGLKPLADMPNLKILTYPSYRFTYSRIGSTNLEPLAGLKKLEELHLSNCGVSDADLIHLKDVQTLRRLYLDSNPNLKGEGLQHLKGLTNLTILTLTNCPLADDSLQHLAGLTNLEDLPLFGTPITDKGLEHLKNLKKLTSLKLGYTKVAGSGFVHLAGLTDVNQIYLDGTPTTDEHLKHLAGMKRLVTLELSNTQVTGVGFAALKDLPDLTELRLRESPVSDDGLKPIGQLKSLTNLSLDNSKITDAGLEHLKELTNLNELTLAATELKGSGLAHLSGMKELETLYLGNTKVTDESMKHLAPLKALKMLEMYNTPVGDAALAELKGNTNLQHLGLTNTKVTDAGLVHLKGMKKLQSLSVRMTGVTVRGIADLKKTLPKMYADIASE